MNEKPKINKQTIFLIVVILILLVGAIVSLILISQPQILKKEAAPVCPSEGAYCQWSYPDLDDYCAPWDDKEECKKQKITFQYEIVDLTTGETIKSGTTESMKVTFTPQVDHTYQCRVRPVSPSCGQGPEKTTTETCRAEPTPTVPVTPTEEPTQTPSPTEILTSTPTPEASPSATPTLTPTLTTTPTASPTATLTPTPTPTPTPTGELTPAPKEEPTATPAPTEEPTSTPTPTEVVVAQAPTETASPTATVEATSPPSPSLPPAGIPTFIKIFSLVSFLIILIGLIL